MRISSTNNLSFRAGSVKFSGIKMEELSKNCKQLTGLAIKKKMDFSILKHSSSEIHGYMDTYTVIASKEIAKEPFIIHGIGVAKVTKSADIEYVSLKILSAVLEAIDKINLR